VQTIASYSRNRKVCPHPRLAEHEVDFLKEGTRKEKPGKPEPQVGESESSEGSLTMPPQVIKKEIFLTKRALLAVAVEVNYRGANPRLSRKPFSVTWVARDHRVDSSSLQVESLPNI
jgi:hypothetical protein